MKTITPRLWTSLTGAALVLGAAAPVATAQDYPGGTLDHALEKMFDGEGGEGGIGMSKLSDGVTFPALKGAQVEQAFTGNTIRSGNRFAVHLAPGGKVEGWSMRWAKAAESDCAGKRPGFARDEDGSCIRGTQVAVDGAWAVRDDELCLPAVFEAPMTPTVEPRRCYRTVLALNSVLPFDEAGALVRRPVELAKGRSLDKQP